MSDTQEILTERGNRYGKFIDNATIAQEFKAVYREHFRLKMYDADQREAIDMICSKLSRIINGDADHLDSWMDIAGYATLVADRLKGNEL